MADEDELFPSKVDAHCKVHKQTDCPRKGATDECHMECLASQRTRAAGDVGIPRNCKHQAMYAQAYRTSVARMFLSLGLDKDIVDTIVDNQGYNSPHALSCLDKKGVEQLVTAICKPGRMKSGTQNPGINVPFYSQEIITGKCIAHKYQRRCGEKFHPSFVNFEILEKLGLQQEIEDAHGSKEAYNTQPVWDPKNPTASANLIEQHFCRIQGIDGAPRAYLMRKHIIPSLTPGPLYDRAK